MRRHLFSPLLLALTLAGASFAQTAGNLVVGGGNAVLEVSSSAVTTLAVLPNSLRVIGVAPSFDNQAVVVVGFQARLVNQTVLVLEVRGGKVRTLGSATGSGKPSSGLQTQGGIVPDQAGDYVFSSPVGVHRVSRNGGPVTTVHGGAATGLCADLTSGGWLLYNSPRTYRLRRSGVRTTVASFTTAMPAGIGTLAPDPRNGDAYLALNHLYRVSPPRATIVTLAKNLGTARCVAVEPWSGDLFVGNNLGIVRLDRGGAIKSTVANLAGVWGLCIFGSNHLAGRGAAKPGTRWILGLSFPREPKRFYRCAAAFGFGPGIPLPGGGVIPLAPDSLFTASFKLPTVFAGFGGQLDGTGRGVAAVNIPNIAALKGVMLYFAALTYDAKGVIGRVSEPERLQIE